MADVEPGTFVRCGDIWWQITEPDTDNGRGWWIGVTVIPGICTNDAGDTTEWEVGAETTWSNNQVIADKGETIAEIDVPDEIWVKIAMHAMGVIEGGE